MSIVFSGSPAYLWWGEEDHSVTNLGLLKPIILVSTTRSCPYLTTVPPTNYGFIRISTEMPIGKLMTQKNRFTLRIT